MTVSLLSLGGVEGMDAIAAMSGPVLDRLWQTSWQAGLMAIVVWLACRRWPRLHANVRMMLWWLVCAKFVVGLAWTQPIALPVLPAGSMARTPTAALLTTDATVDGEASGAPAIGAMSPVAAPVASRESEPVVRGWFGGMASAMSWFAVLLLLWLAGLALQGAILVRQLARTRAIVARSRPVRGDVGQLFDDLRTRVGLSGTVHLHASTDIVTPQVTGIVHPLVLVPAPALEAWSRAELSMTLCHELLHVRRFDLWHGWIPSAAARLFFFHPLARLATREYALAREAACDASVLRLLNAPPDAYGQLLLRLGVTRHDVAPAAAGASVSLRTLKRRLIMLHDASIHARPISARWWPLAVIVAVAVIAIVPIRLVATPAPSVAAKGAKATKVDEKEKYDEQDKKDKVEKQVKLEKQDKQEKEKTRQTSKTVASHDDDDWGIHEPWVLLDSDHTSMSGHMRHIDEARRLQSDPSDRLLWFMREGRAYVVRDPAMLGTVHDLFEPQSKLGEQQGELGKRQGALGAEQAALGEKQGGLGAQQGELGAKMAEANADLMSAIADELRGRGNADELHKRKQDAEARLQDLGKQMDALGRQQGELGRAQGALGDKQGELGRQQGELGRQQGELARQATRQLRELLDKALATGLATPVR